MQAVAGWSWVNTLSACVHFQLHTSHVNNGVRQMIRGTSTSKRYGQDGSLNGVWCQNMTAAECLLIHRGKKKRNVPLVFQKRIRPCLLLLE